MAKTMRAEGLEFLDRAPVRIREETVIGAPPSEVWPALADPAAWTDWFVGMGTCRPTSPEPVTVGSTRYVEVKALKVNETILAFDVERTYAFRLDDANVPVLAAMVERITLTPDDRATLVVYEQALEVVRWAKPLAPVVRRQLTSGLRQSLAELDRWVLAHRSTR